MGLDLDHRPLLQQESAECLWEMATRSHLTKIQELPRYLLKPLTSILSLRAVTQLRKRGARPGFSKEDAGYQTRRGG